MPPGPRRRFSLGQLVLRLPPPPNVLASGPGGGGATASRSANGRAAPASASAEARAGGRSFGAAEPAKRGARNAREHLDAAPGRGCPGCTRPPLRAGMARSARPPARRRRPFAARRPRFFTHEI